MALQRQDLALCLVHSMRMPDGRVPTVGLAEIPRTEGQQSHEGHVTVGVSLVR